ACGGRGDDGISRGGIERSASGERPIEGAAGLRDDVRIVARAAQRANDHAAKRTPLVAVSRPGGGRNPELGELRSQQRPDEAFVEPLVRGRREVVVGEGQAARDLAQDAAGWL